MAGLLNSIRRPSRRGNCGHRHDVPRRPAGPAAVHRRADGLDSTTCSAELGGPRGVIRQTEFFLYTEQRSGDARPLPRLGHRYPECTGWIRANKGDFRLVEDAGLKETGHAHQLLGLPHLQKLKFKSRKSAWTRYCEVVEDGVCRRRAAAVPPGGRYPGRHRRLRAALRRAADANERAGARRLDGQDPALRHDGIWLELSRAWPCRGAFPSSFYKLNQEVGRPQRPPGMARPQRLPQGPHQRGDRLALRLRRAQRDAFRFRRADRQPAAGRRVIEYIALKGDLCGDATPESSPSWPTTCGPSACRFPDNYPFVGRNFNTTQAGIHAGGLRQDERIYNIFDTTKLLRPPPRVSITDKSGPTAWPTGSTSFFGLKGDRGINVIKMHKLARWVTDQYEKSRPADGHQRRGDGSEGQGDSCRTTGPSTVRGERDG